MRKRSRANQFVDFSKVFDYLIFRKSCEYFSLQTLTKHLTLLSSEPVREVAPWLVASRKRENGTSCSWKLVSKLGGSLKFPFLLPEFTTRITPISIL